MVDVLKKIDARNGGRRTATACSRRIPATKDRIASIEKQIKPREADGTATVEARYKQNITFDAKPITEIAMDVEGAAGLASGDKKKEDDKKADEPRRTSPRRRAASASASITGGKQQAQSTQQTASAGARGGVPDRDAKGGPNKNPLGVKVTAAELEAFKKGIAA